MRLVDRKRSIRLIVHKARRRVSLLRRSVYSFISIDISKIVAKMGSQKRKRTPAGDDSLEDDDEESSPQSARLRRDLVGLLLYPELGNDRLMPAGSIVL